MLQTNTTLILATGENISTNIADAAGTWQFTETIATDSSRFYRSYAP